MNATTLGLLDAIAGRPARKEREGALRAEVDVDGVIFDCTYDLKGSYCPACREGPTAGPAEFPFVELVSAKVGDWTLRGDALLVWDSRVGLTEKIEEKLDAARGEHYEL